MAWLSGGDGPFLGFIRSKASVGKVGKMHRCDNSRERTKDIYIYTYIYIYFLHYCQFGFFVPHFSAFQNGGRSTHFIGFFCAKKKLPKNRKM